jgi:hypothetical protein
VSDTELTRNSLYFFSLYCFRYYSHILLIPTIFQHSIRASSNLKSLEVLWMQFIAWIEHIIIMGLDQGQSMKHRMKVLDHGAGLSRWCKLMVNK